MPYEYGLGKFCNMQTAIGCIGRDALLRVAKEGPVGSCDQFWPVMAKGKQVGAVSLAVWSPDFKTNVAIAMVRVTH